MRCRLLGGVLASCIVVMTSAHGLEYEPPRLTDGQVDLQGVWSHKNMTPLERPAELATLVISPEQAAQLQARLAARLDDLSKPAEPSEYFWERTIEPIDGEYRSSIIIDPADGRIPGNEHFRALAKTTRDAVLTAFDGPEQRPAGERCLLAVSAAPPTLGVPASDLRQIVQTRDSIVISSEELNEARVVRLNAKHAPAALTSWLGDSIGWWEVDTLVIETRHFTATSSARLGPFGVLLFVGPNTIVTERITRVAHDELRYAFTVEDPTYYTQPWKGETRFEQSDDRMLEYACHEGNYSLAYALQSARALEAEKRMEPRAETSSCESRAMSTHCDWTEPRLEVQSKLHP